MPDAHSSALHLGFPTEEASVLGVLAFFNFLHHLPEGSTTTGAIFTHDSNLLGVFGHFDANLVRAQRAHFPLVDGRGFFFFFLLSLFAISWAAPEAYGGSLARGPIRAVAAGLRQGHSNSVSKLRLRATPQLTATLDH